jgi:hypothetical protein
MNESRAKCPVDRTKEIFGFVIERSEQTCSYVQEFSVSFWELARLRLNLPANRANLCLDLLLSVSA